MGKILIIGSSYSIKETFSKKFSSDDVKFVKFRNIWEDRNIDFYDIIILSGYHHYILQYNFDSIRDYIISYYKFVSYLEKKTNFLLLVSTHVPKKVSFSRVVFFYKILQEKLIHNRKIKIATFKKIIDSKLKNSFFIKLLQILGIKFTDQEKLINLTSDYYLIKISNPKFYFLKIKRPVLVERLLRLLDFD